MYKSCTRNFCEIDPRCLSLHPDCFKQAFQKTDSQIYPTHSPKNARFRSIVEVQLNYITHYSFCFCLLAYVMPHQCNYLNGPYFIFFKTFRSSLLKWGKICGRGFRMEQGVSIIYKWQLRLPRTKIRRILQVVYSFALNNQHKYFVWLKALLDWKIKIISFSQIVLQSSRRPQISIIVCHLQFNVPCLKRTTILLKPNFFQRWPKHVKHIVRNVKPEPQYTVIFEKQ